MHRQTSRIFSKDWRDGDRERSNKKIMYGFGLLLSLEMNQKVVI